MNWIARIVFPIMLLFISPNARALDVQVSTFSENGIVIVLTSGEVQQALRGKSRQLGREAAARLMRLVGMPQSVTGKVANLGVWPILVDKYSRDIATLARSVDRGQSLSLKYYGVDIQGLRKLWKVSAIGDMFLPGSEEGRLLIEAVNTATNADVK